MTREEAIESTINGLRHLGLLYLGQPFKVLCTGGACWSADTVYIERGQLKESAQEWMEDNLRKRLLDPLYERVEGELVGSTAQGQHRTEVVWVDSLDEVPAKPENVYARRKPATNPIKFPPTRIVKPSTGSIG